MYSQGTKLFGMTLLSISGENVTKQWKQTLGQKFEVVYSYDTFNDNSQYFGFYVQLTRCWYPSSAQRVSQ